MLRVLNGIWWYGGNRKLEFKLDKFCLISLKQLKKDFPKKQGFIIELLIKNQKITLKKEAGAFNYFIKTPKKYKRLKTKNLKKLIERK